MSTPTTQRVGTGSKVLIWLFALATLLGIGFMSWSGSQNALAVSDYSATATYSANAPDITTSTMSVNQSVTDMNFAAPAVTTDGASTNATVGVCVPGQDTRTTALPALRWSDFQLSLWDDSLVVKTQAILSGAASAFFYVGDLAWKFLLTITNFGVTFEPLCKVASPVNSIVAKVGTIMSWAIVPAFIVWGLSQRKNFTRGRMQKMLPSFVSFLLFTGGVFYMTDTARSVEGASNTTVLTTPGTAPWLGNKIVGGFATAYTSVTQISGMAGVDTADVSAFLDGKASNSDPNKLSCRAFVNGTADQRGAWGLYGQYTNEMGALASKPQAAMMSQLSKVWEQAYLSSWIRAQFGTQTEGDKQFGSRAACRHLEATVADSNEDKAQLFLDAQGSVAMGWSRDQVINSGLVHFMQPIGETFRLPNDMVWAACVYKEDGWQLAPGVDGTSGKLGEQSKKNLQCSAEKDGEGAGSGLGPANGNSSQNANKKLEDVVNELGQKNSMIYLETGESDVKKFIGYEEDGKQFRSFALASIGENMGTRISQGLVAMVVSFIYLWAFGPMAAGLVIAAIAMLILLALVPGTLWLLSIGSAGGLKLAKLTGAVMGASFFFGLVLSFMTLIMDLMVGLVKDIIGIEGFFAQLVLAAVPIAVVLLLRRLLSMLGFGNVMSMSGSLGFATTAAAAAVGGNRGARSVADAFNKAGGKAGGAFGAGTAGARRVVGTGASMLSKNGRSALQKRIEDRLGATALGRRVQAGASKAASAARAAKTVAGAEARQMGEALGMTAPGRKVVGAANAVAGLANAGKDKVVGAARAAGAAVAASPIGKASKTIASLAGNKQVRYAAALGAGGTAAVAAGVAGPAALGLAAAAAGAVPAYSMFKRKLLANDQVQSGIAAKYGISEAEAKQGLASPYAMKDDEGNLVTSPRELAASRNMGLMEKADRINMNRAKQAISQMSPQELQQLSADFHPTQVAGLPTTSKADQASKQALSARRYISRIEDPELRKQAINEFTEEQLNAVRAAQHGAKSPDGINTAFGGFDNEIARQLGKQTLAAKLNIDESDIVMGMHGLAVPAPSITGKRLPNGAPSLPEGVSMDLAGHPALYMDQETLRRERNETDEQYAARITASMSARGLIADDGKAVNVLQAHGIDTDTAAGAARVEAWLGGGRDELLSSIEYRSVKGESQIQRAAQKWSNDHTIDIAERQWDRMVVAQEIRTEALNDLRHMDDIAVALKPVSSATGDAPRFEVSLDPKAQALESTRMHTNGVVQVDPERIGLHGIQVPAGNIQVDAQTEQLPAVSIEGRMGTVNPAVDAANQVVNIAPAAAGAAHQVVNVDAPAVGGANHAVNVAAPSVNGATPTVNVATQALNPANPATTRMPTVELNGNLLESVTLKDVTQAFSSRVAGMRGSIQAVAIAQSHDESLEAQRRAASDFRHLESMDKEAKQILNGLAASTYARAHLKVDHYAATYAGQVSVSQLKRRSAEALQQAESEVANRSETISRKMKELFRYAKVAQHAASEEDRKLALKSAGEQMSQLEETMRALYAEERKAAEELASETEAAFEQMDEMLASGNPGFTKPGHSVISSASILSQMKEQRAAADYNN